MEVSGNLTEQATCVDGATVVEDGQHEGTRQRGAEIIPYQCTLPVHRATNYAGQLRQLARIFFVT